MAYQKPLIDLLDYRGGNAARWANEGVTAAIVAANFRDENVPHSWVPWCILQHTLKHPEFRTDIHPQDIVRAYENGVDADARGMSREGGAAYAERSEKVLQYVQDDERLSGDLTPAYVYTKFLEAKNEGRLMEASIRLESTLTSPKARALFTPQDIADLVREAVTADDYRIVMNVFKTIDNNTALRSAMTPELIGFVFKSALLAYKTRTDVHGEKQHHYTHVATQLLKFTINDHRLRAGISRADIALLEGFYADVIKNPEGFSDSSKRIDAENAQKGLESVQLFTLVDPSADELARLAAPFNRAARATRMWHEAVHLHNVLDGLRRYAEAKNIPMVA